MTLQSAIQSGKAFRHRGRKAYFTVDDRGRIIKHLFIGKNAGWGEFPAELRMKDILADDWELKD